MTHAAADAGTMIFRRTNAHAGRHISVTPANSTNRHLCYARIILNSQTPAASFDSGNHETGLIVLNGAAEVKANGESHHLGRFDSIYLPRKSHIEVSTSSHADLAEFSAEVSGDNPVQVVRYEDVSANPALSFQTGTAGQHRTVNITLGKNVSAHRLLAGFTISDPGNWTSWPPHEHAELLEEMYVYFDMPEPAFAIQLVYNSLESPEVVTIVRDGDAVLMPSGYHPNVSVPGHRIAFLWAMAAHREVEGRQFGVVNVQPGFGNAGSGLEASRK
jgi:5-deoxy-glucuronate isomerase